jgi:hypothetical protein
LKGANSSQKQGVRLKRKLVGRRAGKTLHQTILKGQVEEEVLIDEARSEEKVLKQGQQLRPVDFEFVCLVSVSRV